MRRVLVLVLVVVTGCGPTLYAVSTPPPTRTATLHSWQPLFGKRRHRAEVSVGVALAFSCTGGEACRNAKASVDDSAVLEVVPAHLNRLATSYVTPDATPPATFVLFGLRPGKTTVRVKSDDGTVTVRVTVVE